MAITIKPFKRLDQYPEYAAVRDFSFKLQNIWKACDKAE